MSYDDLNSWIEDATPCPHYNALIDTIIEITNHFTDQEQTARVRKLYPEDIIYPAQCRCYAKQSAKISNINYDSLTNTYYSEDDHGTICYYTVTNNSTGSFELRRTHN